MTELIFNADDFGTSPSVNRSIVCCAQAGLLTSASVMVTHSAAGEAVRLNDALSQPLRLGLHFCLTSGRACAPAETIPLLANADGSFRHGFLSLARLLNSSYRSSAAAQISIELQAQYARFEELLAQAPRTKADHLDSHQHIHVFPLLRERFQALAQEKNLTMRVPSEPVVSWLRRLRAPFLFHVKGILKKGILDHCLYRRGAPFRTMPLSPIYFGIIDSGRMNFAAVTAILDTLPKLTKRKGFQNRQVEINIHPWRITGENGIVPESASAADQRFGTSPQREEEFNLLTKQNPQIRAKMSDLGITISHFKPPVWNR